jgi:hypothetical protein
VRHRAEGKTKIGSVDFKKRRASQRGTLKETPKQETGSSDKPRSGPAATNVTAGGNSDEGSDKQMARHFPEVKTKIPLMGDGRLPH